MMGLVVTSRMSFTVCSRLVRSTHSMSGFPLAVESVRLLSHIASNSAVRPSPDRTAEFSTIKALRPLWASNTLTNPFLSRSCFSLPRRMSGVVPTSRMALFNCVDEMPGVYSGSTSLPPHSFSTSTTRERVSLCTPSFQSEP